MQKGAGERTAVFVVRAWREPATSAMRARVTWTLDVVREEPSVEVVADPSDVKQALADWLKAIGSE